MEISENFKNVLDEKQLEAYMELKRKAEKGAEDYNNVQNSTQNMSNDEMENFNFIKSTEVGKEANTKEE